MDSEGFSSGSEEVTPRILRRRTDEGSTTVVRRKSPRKGSKKGDEVKKSFFPKSVADTKAMLQSLTKNLKGTEYTPGVSVRVIKAALTLHLEWMEHKRRLGQVKVKGQKFSSIREKVCELFGVSKATFSKITRTYIDHGELYTTGVDGGGRVGGQDNGTKRIKDRQSTILLVREYVRKRRQAKQKVTSSQVTEHLLLHNVIHVEKDAFGVYDSKGIAAAGRAVRRFLTRHGYQRGRRKGTYVPSPENLAKRDIYLRTLIENRSKPPQERLREVYLDESYIHHHYRWKEGEDLYDPNDPDDVVFGKDRYKGSRYCFICAIQGPATLPRGLPDDQGGVVPGSWWHFSPTKRADHKGDYHKVFKSENFVPWFRDKLLPGLNEPSLIIMDNARYHQTYGDWVPKVYKAKKERLQEYLTFRGVGFNQSDTLSILQAKARKCIEDYEMIETERLAENEGHKVLWTAPGYSDLQPIELTWALIKGNVGRQYDVHTKLKDVEDRLLLEVERLDTPSGINSIQRMIENCYRKSEALWKEITQDDGEQPTEDEDDSGAEDYEDIMNQGDSGGEISDDDGDNNEEESEAELYGV